MSEKTRSIKKKDVTDKEVRNYLMKISALLNEIDRLEGQRSKIYKNLGAEIKVEQVKLEKLRVALNDGVVETLYNFMDKDNHQIIWKDKDGNEVERTPFDPQDWEIYERQYGPRQKPLFNEDEDPFEEFSPNEPKSTPDEGEYENDPGDQGSALNEGDIIDAESEDIDPPSDERSSFDKYGEEEVEAERDAL
jgi:hypothetical protein